MNYRNLDHHNAERFDALRVHLENFAAPDSRQPLIPPIPVSALRLALHGLLMPGLAHEINNRLTAVVGYSQFAQRRGDDCTTNEEIASIEKESLRAASHIRDILDVCRMKDESIAPFDPERLLSNIERLTGGSLRKLDVSLQIDKNHEVRSIHSCYRNALDGLLALLMGYAHVLPRRSVIQLQTLQDASGVVFALNVEWMPQHPAKPGAAAGDSRTQSDEEARWLFPLAAQLLQRANLRFRYDAKSLRLYLHAPVSQSEFPETAALVAEQPPRALIAIETEPESPSQAADSGSSMTAMDCCNIGSLVKFLEEDGFQVYVVESPSTALRAAYGEDYNLLFFNIGRDSAVLETVYHRLKEQRPSLAGRVVFTACQSRYEDCLRLAGNLGRPHLTLPCDQAAFQQLVRGTR